MEMSEETAEYWKERYEAVVQMAQEDSQELREQIVELEKRQNKVLLLLEGCNLSYSRLSTVAAIELCIRTLAAPQAGD
jgi:DNA-directed RNA polymerase specialized sigma24 family protein